MIDEDAQDRSGSDIRPMLSMKQVLTLVPFSRATLYREIEAGPIPEGSRDRAAPDRLVRRRVESLAGRDLEECCLNARP